MTILFIIGYVVIGLIIGRLSARETYRNGGWMYPSTVQPGDPNGASMYGFWTALLWPIVACLFATILALMVVNWVWIRASGAVARIFVGKKLLDSHPESD